MVQDREHAQLTYAEFAECEIDADLALVSGALENLRLSCRQNGLPEERWREVELAAAEGLNNAIVHGGSGAADERIRLRWSWTGEILEVRIFDSGQFVPTRSETPRLPDDPLSESGRGGFLIASLMDEAHDEMCEGWHCLVMSKRVGAKAAPREQPEETKAMIAAMTEDLSNSYENLATFYRFSEELATATSFDDFMRRALQRLGKWAQADEVQVSLDVNGSLALSYYHGPDERVVSRADEHVTLTALPARKDTLEMRVFRADAGSTVEECASLARTDPLWRETGIACACPVLFQGAPIGVVSIVRRKSEPHFSAAQIHLVRAVGDFLGIARTTAILQEQRQSQQRALRELEIASEIQQLLLPRSFPSNAKSRIFGISQAATEVGGDYFDALPIGNRGVLVAIADVMGKGLPAALLATVLRATIRARLDLAAEPGRLLSEINRQLIPDLAKLDMFITAQLAFFCHETNQLIYASAGHCPILMYPRGAAEAALMNAGGIPLGVLSDATYESTCESVNSGDRFVFLTDGLYEVHSPEGEILGLDRISEKIPSIWQSSPSSFCRDLLDFVRAHSGGVPAADDRTVLTIEWQ